MENSTTFGDFKYPVDRTIWAETQQIHRRNKQNYQLAVPINKPGIIISAEICSTM